MYRMFHRSCVELFYLKNYQPVAECHLIVVVVLHICIGLWLLGCERVGLFDIIDHTAFLLTWSGLPMCRNRLSVP